MVTRVLVVDDSVFFQRRVSCILNSDPRIEVIGVAANGQEAVEKNNELKPDVITLDYEMPIMDGVKALKKIMQQRPVPVLMLSSLTFQGASVTLEALEAGAIDFLNKNFDDATQNSDKIKCRLIEKVLAVSRSSIINHRKPSILPHSPVIKTTTDTSPLRAMGKKEILLIGTSTGGPAALQTLFKGITRPLKVPVVIVQHMPASFTNAFAERLDGVSSLKIKEAEDGDKLKPGHAYLAPGAMQLTFKNRDTICIRESDKSINYRPCVDITFNSAAEYFGDKCLAIVLTGMGADGREGCRTLKEKKADVWTQNEETCVIYGMPMSVEKAGLSDKVLPLEAFADKLMQVLA